MDVELVVDGVEVEALVVALVEVWLLVTVVVMVVSVVDIRVAEVEVDWVWETDVPDVFDETNEVEVDSELLLRVPSWDEDVSVFEILWEVV